MLNMFLSKIFSSSCLTMALRALVLLLILLLEYDFDLSFLDFSPRGKRRFWKINRISDRLWLKVCNFHCYLDCFCVVNLIIVGD